MTHPDIGAAVVRSLRFSLAVAPLWRELARQQPAELAESVQAVLCAWPLATEAGQIGWPAEASEPDGSYPSPLHSAPLSSGVTAAVSPSQPPHAGSMTVPGSDASADLRGRGIQGGLGAPLEGRLCQ